MVWTTKESNGPDPSPSLYENPIGKEQMEIGPELSHGFVSSIFKVLFGLEVRNHHVRYVICLN